MVREVAFSSKTFNEGMLIITTCILASPNPWLLSFLCGLQMPLAFIRLHSWKIFNNPQWTHANTWRIDLERPERNLVGVIGVSGVIGVIDTAC